MLSTEDFIRQKLEQCPQDRSLDRRQLEGWLKNVTLGDLKTPEERKNEGPPVPVDYAKRNREILKLRRKGMSNGEIASRFGLSKGYISVIIQRAAQAEVKRFKRMAAFHASESERLHFYSAWISQALTHG